MGLHTSLGGVEDGMRRVEAVARSIAEPRVRGDSSLSAHEHVAKGAKGAKGIEASVQADAADSVDLSAKAVELIQAEHQVAVNARAISRVAETEQSVLDILA